MDNLIFLDTETTGNDLLKDHLFQVCYSHLGKIYTEYFKPPIPISIKAQSITHITNHMIADKKAFADSQFKETLQTLLKSNVLVAHNAAFDICMLAKEGVEVPQYICTLRVARFLDENCEIPEYNLQYLRYFWEMDITVHPHDAESDVLVLEGIFTKLYQILLEKLQTPEEVIPKMIEISSKPQMYKLINFGKYRGRKVEEIMRLDKRYLEWLLREKMLNESAEEDWIFTLKFHLNRN